MLWLYNCPFRTDVCAFILSAGALFAKCKKILVLTSHPATAVTYFLRPVQKRVYACSTHVDNPNSMVCFSIQIDNSKPVSCITKCELVFHIFHFPPFSLDVPKTENQTKMEGLSAVRSACHVSPYPHDSPPFLPSYLLPHFLMLLMFPLGFAGGGCGPIYLAPGFNTTPPWYS